MVYLFPFQNRDYKQSKCEYLNLLSESKTFKPSTDIPIIVDSPFEAFACCKEIVFIKEAGEQQLQRGRRDVSRTDVC